MLVMFGNLEKAVHNFGLIPDLAWRYGGLTFVTAFFLHAGWGHLLGNAYFLLIFGDNVEDYLGRCRYTLLLLAATIGGGLVHVLWEPRSDISLVGASGGISGIITFYALQFPHARIGFLVRFRWDTIPVWGGLLLWALMQAVGAWLQIMGSSDVSSLGHLGGAAVGVVCWLSWRKRTRIPDISGAEIG